jgi:hypothetical protein
MYLDWLINLNSTEKIVTLMRDSEYLLETWKTNERMRHQDTSLVDCAYNEDFLNRLEEINDSIVDKLLEARLGNVSVNVITIT